MNKKGETYQFSLDENLEETTEELDRGRNIPKKLEEGFLEGGCPIPEDAFVRVKKAGKKWRVKGGAENVYKIKKRDKKLNVYSEPLWHIIASKEVKSRIYLSLIGREVNAKKLEDELEKRESREHFGGYHGSYVRDTVVEMEKEGLLQREIGESKTSGRGRNLVYLYEADVGIYLNYLDRNTDITKPDRQTVEEIITEAASSTLNKGARADTRGANAILDISLLAAAPDYFFRGASLDRVKNRFSDEIEQAVKGFERETEAYLLPLLVEKYESKIMKLIDRLPNFSKGGTELSDDLSAKFTDTFPYFLQALVAVIHNFEDRGENLYQGKKSGN